MEIWKRAETVPVGSLKRGDVFTTERGEYFEISRTYCDEMFCDAVCVISKGHYTGATYEISKALIVDKLERR